MNTSMNVFPFGQKMLGRWGSRYILLAQIGVQLISFAAASGGILYILLNVEFTPQQVRALFLGVGALVIFVNIILMPVMHFASSNARRRLKLFGLGFTGAVDAQLEFKAWREITSFPWRFGWSASVAALFAVILPITLIMYYAARVTFDDAVHVAEILVVRRRRRRCRGNRCAGPSRRE